MERAAYLPLVSGLLRAYAETDVGIRDSYEFMPFLYYRDSVENIMAVYDNPSVAAFSVSMWNEQLNLNVARLVKERFPDCLVVFGGPNVPHSPTKYFSDYPFIDVAVRGEGEEAFREILTQNLISRNFENILGISWKNPMDGRCVVNDGGRAQPRDLDVYPSPYVQGLYDDLFEIHKDLEFQQIIETNRGCPFLCTFCFWGQGGLSTKYRFHSLEYVQSEIIWAGQHRIKYVFNADSNFGMHKRDSNIADMLVNAKEDYGYPDKFRTCFGKNTDEKIFNVARILHQNNLEKGITLARQSNDATVLENIKRTNIKMETYRNLQTRFNEHDIPVYCELILGLPGESYNTWVSGIDDLLQSGLRNQLFVYMCQIYENTEMCDLSYREKFNIQTKILPLTEIHGAVRSGELVVEYEEIVVSTETMSQCDWRKSAVFSWFTMLFHSMKLGFFVLYYIHERFGLNYSDLTLYILEHVPNNIDSVVLKNELHEFDAQLDNILDCHGRGLNLPEFGNIYWDEEEASFLRISNNIEQFYIEFLAILKRFLDYQGVRYDLKELEEVILYQKLRIPTHRFEGQREYKFTFNIPEYFETSFMPESKSLAPQPQVLFLDNSKDFEGDKLKYAKECILWGRKSGTMLTDVTWESLH